jgi:hypothetical protein
MRIRNIVSWKRHPKHKPVSNAGLWLSELACEAVAVNLTESGTFRCDLLLKFHRTAYRHRSIALSAQGHIQHRNVYLQACVSSLKRCAQSHALKLTKQPSREHYLNIQVLKRSTSASYA